MTSSRPIGLSRTVWLIARLSLRRQLNLWQSARLWNKKKSPAGSVPGEVIVRSGTPAKSSGKSVLSIFLLLVMAFNGFNIASRGLLSLSANSSDSAGVASDKIPVRVYTRAKLVQAERELLSAQRLSDPIQREKYLGMWNRYVDELFIYELRGERLSEDDENNRLQNMRAVFTQKGAQGFTARSADTFWVSAETWPREAQPNSIFLRSLSLIVLLWMPFIVFGSLGLNNKNLGEVEWNFEWLYTFPASARALFTSKFFVYSFLNPLVWVFFYPFLVLIYVSAGFGFMAIPLGLAVLLYLSILAGALCTFLEVALRKLLTLGQLKNVQALFTVIGTVSLLLIYASCLSKPLDDFLVARATAMPEFLAWNPFSLPLFLGIPLAPASHAPLVASLMLLLTLAFPCLALLGSEWLTRDGLVKAGGPYQGTRRIPASPSGDTWLRGIAAQELLLLARDRNLLVQVLVVPLLLPVFYLLIYSGMASAVSGNFRHAATMAFGVGAYSFLSSAMQLLNREDKTLWQLLTFPQPLATILVKKTMVWAALGLLYGITVLLLITRFSRHLHANSWGEVFLALYGIVLYAFIASGIGILATNVLETERRARTRTDMIYLYMILAAMYANTIYSPSLWTKLAQLVLSTLLAFALWQKVKDNCPYLLDPVALPPRSVSLADGMIAALAFFVLQGLLFLLFHSIAESSLPAEITFAYIFAGLIVAALALHTFWRQDVPHLWQKVGVSRTDVARKTHPLWRGLLLGAAWGAVAALGAAVYIRVLNLFPQAQIWKQDAELSSFLSRADRPIWICILVIVAAPLFEEFLFRGLIFQGLRRTAGPALAVLGSAALFALVHPPISVVPVFGLGIAAAISFQQSGFLLAPILTHAVYNACVIFFNKF
jgi:ABC-2 type transport system permease protein